MRRHRCQVSGCRGSRRAPAANRASGQSRAQRPCSPTMPADYALACRPPNGPIPTASPPRKGPARLRRIRSWHAIPTFRAFLNNLDPQAREPTRSTGFPYYPIELLKTGRGHLAGRGLAFVERRQGAVYITFMPSRSRSRADRRRHRFRPIAVAGTGLEPQQEDSLPAGRVAADRVVLIAAPVDQPVSIG